LEPLDLYLDSRLDRLFPILLKYSVDKIEKSIIKHLEASKEIHDIASLLMISKLLGSDQLYGKAKNLLINHSKQIRPDDAGRIGADSLYEVMIERYNKLAANQIRCRDCGEQCSAYCRYCQIYQ
jgi:hypothetical protein